MNAAQRVQQYRQAFEPLQDAARERLFRYVLTLREAGKHL